MGMPQLPAEFPEPGSRRAAASSSGTSSDALVARRLGVSCQDVVFLDDQPVNLAGAADVGMTAVPVDVTDPGTSFARARELIGLR